MTQMMMVLLVGGLLGMVVVELLLYAGMDPITAKPTGLKGSVMCAATWWRLPLSPPTTSTRDLPYMDTMSTFQLPRGQNTGGLYTCVKTLPVGCCMWEAPWMFVRDGPARRKLAWTGTTPTQGCTSTSWLGARLTRGMETWGIWCGPSLTSLTPRKQYLQMLDMWGVLSADVPNALDWNKLRTSGYAD